MRRAMVVLGVIGLLMASPVLASMAEARVGGGGSSGSRGSRSYSAPRSPSAPASPLAPAPNRPAAPGQPTPQRPGGFLGGLGGMLGGLVLGGLLGSLLFGGLGGGLGGFGGLGLIEILLVAGLVYLAFQFFRRRQPEPAVASGPGSAYSATGWAPSPTQASEAGPAVAVDGDLDKGVAAIRMMDPAFDPAGVRGVARELFLQTQAAWTAGDLAPIRAHLTDEMAATLEGDLGRLRALRRTNRLEKVVVQSADATEAWQEYGRDFVTVRVGASALDYTVDASGAVVEGSSTTPTSFEEFWTLTRPVGPNPWRLSAIQQPSA